MWSLMIGVVCVTVRVHAETEQIDLKALAKKARPAVMLLVISDANGKEIATGTGFLVSSDGKLITNHHVIEGAASAVAKAENGGLFPVEGVLADDPKNDLVLLKLRGKDLPFLTLSTNATIEVGTRIAVIGSPLGLEGTLSEGIVSAVRSLFNDDQRWIQITAPISPGSSGSPVLDAEGQIVGVTTFLMHGGQSLNFAVPSGTAALLLGKAKLLTNSVPLIAVVAGFDVADSELWTSPEMKGVLAARSVDDSAGLLKAAQALVARFPKSAQSHQELGNAYMELRLYDKAVAAWRQSIKLKPSVAAVWNDLGVAYYFQGDYDDAIDALRRSVQLAPDDYANTWCTLGKCYLKKDRPDDAIPALRAAIKIDSKDAGTWCVLGDAYRDQNRFAEAVQMYHSAIKLNPDWSNAWLGLVYAHGLSTYFLSDQPERARQFEMADEALKKLSRLDPDRARTVAEILSEIPR